MIWQLDLLLLVLVVISAVMSLWIRDLMGAAIAFGIYSFLMCLVWAGMGAVDVAFTEAAVGAGVSTVFLVGMIYHTRRAIHFNRWDIGLKAVTAVVVVFVGWLLLSAVSDFPEWGDAYSPVNRHVASYYIENVLEDTKVPNIVTAVLADYRSFDTMFETGVVFVAMIGIYAILRRKDDDKEPASGPPHHAVDSLVIRTAARFMVPFMQLFALYVVAHGHHSPGGGFQGGVILGASLILLSMTTSLKETMTRMSERWILLLGAIGVFIFAGWGALCMVMGGNFLDYSVLAPLLPATGDVMARSHSMLFVEIGVAFTVMVGMYGIYAFIASDGRLKEGL